MELGLRRIAEPHTSNRRRIEMLDGRDNLGAEGVGRMAGHLAEGAGEVRLIGEAQLEAEFGKGDFGVEEDWAGGADAEAAGIFADAFALKAAEDAGKVNGMDAGFGAQIFERDARGGFGVEFIEHAGKPTWRMRSFFQGKAGGKGGEFGEEAFDAERV